jgi:D-3-phosphoglycerate dehydrogenase
MKVLVADSFEQSGLDGLAAAGCDVSYAPGLKEQALEDALRTSRAQVLIVRSTSVTASMLDTSALSLVVRAGAGYNNVDVRAASARGIYVSNCPGRNAVAVAELTIGLMLSLDRRIPDNVSELREGRWNKKAFSSARGVFGRTIGILGYGQIGREVAARAHALGMHVAAWSRSLVSEQQIDSPNPLTVVPTPQALAEQSDVFSIHLALAPGTRGLVDRSVLERLRPGAFVINTARAEIVDMKALAEVAAERHLRIGLDVFPNEPAAGTGSFHDPILSLPNVYGTHHIGASTEQAQEAIARETVRIVRTYKETGRVPNAVNLAATTPATHVMIVRHVDRPGVLAHVFDRLREHGLNVQEMENVVFDGATAAVARIHLDTAPPSTVVDAIKAGNPHVMTVEVVAIRQ